MASTVPHFLSFGPFIIIIAFTVEVQLFRVTASPRPAAHRTPWRNPARHRRAGARVWRRRDQELGGRARCAGVSRCGRRHHRARLRRARRRLPQHGRLWRGQHEHGARNDWSGTIERVLLPIAPPHRSPPLPVCLSFISVPSHVTRHYISSHSSSSPDS